MRRNRNITNISVKVGATSHIRKTGPRPDRKGGALSEVPPSIWLTPGNIKAAPMVLATAYKAPVVHIWMTLPSQACCDDVQEMLG